MPTSISSSKPLQAGYSSDRRQRTTTTMKPQQASNKSSNGAPAKKEKAVRYRECRKNHAANIGGYAVDGCMEFMAAGEEGTSEALKCAACSCHRSFHKREVEDDADLAAAAAAAAVCDCSSNSGSWR